MVIGLHSVVQCGAPTPPVPQVDVCPTLNHLTHALKVTVDDGQVKGRESCR